MAWTQERLAEKCRADYERLIGPLRIRARDLGYALGVHGSLARDIDIIAAPWIEGAATAQQLADALIETARDVNGIAFLAPHEEAEFPRRRPNGRLCWSIHLGAGPYIDLSVLPSLA